MMQETVLRQASVVAAKHRDTKLQLDLFRNVKSSGGATTSHTVKLTGTSDHTGSSIEHLSGRHFRHKCQDSIAVMNA